MIKYKPRPARIEDLKDWKVGPSIRAWTLEGLEGSVAGVGGVILAPGAFQVCLSVYDKNIPKKTIWRAIKQGLAEIEKMNLNLIAVRDLTTGSSERLLKRTGFEYIKTVGNNELWIRK